MPTVGSLQTLGAGGQTPTAPPPAPAPGPVTPPPAPPPTTTTTTTPESPASTLPQYLSPQYEQDLQNILFLLNPSFDTSEVDTRAAEANVGRGVEGSPFGFNAGQRMLDSERIARMQLGNQLLEPYLARENQGRLQTQAEQSRLTELAQQGRQAMEQLRLSEAGQTARLTQEEQARLQQLAVQGQQALEQLRVQGTQRLGEIAAQGTTNTELERLRQAGESSRLNTQIGGQLTNTLLSQLLSGAGSRSYSGGAIPVAPPGTNNIGTGASGTPTSPRTYSGPVGITPVSGYSNGIPYYTPPPPMAYNPAAVGRPNPAASGAPVTRTGASVLGIGTGSIDSILRRYGIQV